MIKQFEGRVLSPKSGSTFDRNYPIRVYVASDYNEDDGELQLDRTEAYELVTELMRLCELFDQRESSFVQVVFKNGDTTSRRYTYFDPSGELEVGDEVIVPTQFNPDTNATVVALGRGSFTGDTSSVTAKLVTERVEL